MFKLLTKVLYEHTFLERKDQGDALVFLRLTTGDLLNPKSAHETRGVYTGGNGDIHVHIYNVYIYIYNDDQTELPSAEERLQAV